MATRSPFPASTCRSTQLYATLSLPPTNHLANGASDQSSTSVNGVSHDNRSACSAQNASRSFSAASYNSAVALAFAAKSAGGGYDDGTSVCVSDMFVSVVTERCINGGNSYLRGGRLPPTTNHRQLVGRVLHRSPLQGRRHRLRVFGARSEPSPSQIDVQLDIGGH